MARLLVWDLHHKIENNSRKIGLVKSLISLEKNWLVIPAQK